MTSLYSILDVLELLPSPYVIVKYGEETYTISGRNRAYLQHLDAQCKTGARLADSLPFKEPLFEKKLYRYLRQSREQQASNHFLFETVSGNYEVSITPLKPAEPGVFLLIQFTMQPEAEPVIVHHNHPYYGFLDDMMEGCQVIDFDWNYVYINKTAAAQIKLEHTSYTGKNIFEVLPRLADTVLFPILEAAMKENQIRKLEYEFTYADQSTAWFDLHIYPSKDGLFILSLEITEKKKHEEQLQKSEQRFHALYERSVDIIVVLDQQMRISYGSPSAKKHLGWLEEDLRGIHALALVHEDDQPLLKELFTTVRVYPERAVELEVRIRHKNGHYVWIEGSITNLLHNKLIEGFVLNIHDATERKKSESSLVKSEKELKLAQEIARIGYIHFDLVGSNSFWSEEMYQIWEVDKTFSLTIEHFLRTIHPDDKIKYEEFLLKLFAGFSHHEIEFRILTGDGRVKYIFQRTELEHNEAGEVTALNGIALNITERRQTEIALKESDEKFKTLFNSSPLPQWLFDSDTLRFTDVNEAAIKNYGYSRAEFLEMTIDDIRPAKDVERLLKMREHIIKSQEDFHVHRKKNGELISVDIKASNVVIDGKNTRLVIARDITAELAFEKQLLESNERYNLVLEATHESVIDWDIINDVTIWGKGFEKNFGYDLTKYDNHLWSRNIYKDDRDRVLSDLEVILMDKTKRHFEAAFRYVKADGDIAYIQHRGIILRNDSGMPVRAIGAMIDVTELNEKMTEIEQQNETLRNIAWIQSHVVRAPLARMMGLINLLENEQFPVDSSTELSKILSYIVNAAYELDLIIKDIVKKTEKIQQS